VKINSNMKTLKEVKDYGERIIREAIAEYKPKYIFALYSGGHDSVTATAIAASMKCLDAVVHVNTGIGIDETRNHARQQTDEFGYEFVEYEATENTYADGRPAPMIYRDIVLKHGFPGPAMHSKMYVKLKERSLARLMRDLSKKRGEKVMLISGVRQEESIRRMGHVRPAQAEGSRIWVAPIIEFIKLHCKEFREAEGIKPNPVVECLGMSGECLCGAFAKPGELARIGEHYPETAARIRNLEEEVKDAGFPWGWEEEPPSWWKKYINGQDFLDESFMPLCMGCTSRRNNMQSQRNQIK
jgi:3'-phosphoadenosine 5'-phosphosulfate sulfotransferase (PAPS reductase)/FAD synthetase